MKIVTFKIEEIVLDMIDQLVRMGYFQSRSEFIRTAIKRLIEEYIRNGVLPPVQPVRRVTKEVKLVRVLDL